jgi:hypothetical protein
MPDTQDLSLRDSIAQALDSDTDAQAAEPVRRDLSGPEHGEVVAEATEAKTAPKSDGTVRDALGRFVPKAAAADNAEAGASPAEKPAQAQPGLDGMSAAPEIAPAPTTAAVPAPIAWSASVREHWAALPPAVQQEVHRREVEVQQIVSRSQHARELAQAFQQSIQPHMMTIQAEGVDPITAVTNLMQVGTRLRFGTPAEKAQTVASIVKSYGVDIMALDGALAGMAPQATPGGVDPSTVQQLVQQQLQPLLMAAQQQRQQAEAQQQQLAAQEVGGFAQAHEFYQDLRHTMADMIEVADRNGQQLSLEEAYQRAAMLHPEVSKVIMARQQGANAQALTTAARRAKTAAVSVKGAAPVGNPGGPEPSSIRESIEAAIEAHSRY